MLRNCEWLRKHYKEWVFCRIWATGSRVPAVSLKSRRDNRLRIGPPVIQTTRSNMKARIKLIIGIAFAGTALMAVTQSSNLGTYVAPSSGKAECYTKAQVELLMKANDWTKEDSETILKLACQFSQRPKK